MPPAVPFWPALAVVEDVGLPLAPADDRPGVVDAWASAFRSRGGLRPEPVFKSPAGRGQQACDNARGEDRKT